MKQPGLQPPPSSDPLASLPTADAVRDRLVLLFTEASLLRSLLRLLERAERNQKGAAHCLPRKEGVRYAD